MANREHDELIDRILSRAPTQALAGQATALFSGDEAVSSSDGDQFDRADRVSLTRVAGLSTELEDVTEVEYRQLRLEKAVLI
ncbi:MAG: GTPase HflX, partial [Actinobacteria bacterium]|nr:GTPase HflX [Actinomycetota bacterium]